MKYLKKFENYSQDFTIDFDKIDTSDIRGHESIINILNQNQLSFDSLLESIKDNIVYFGLASKETKYNLIGTGQYGIAFSFIDKVLKITTSQKEFETCSSLVDLEFEGVVRYYLSFQFDTLPIYIIIQDKLQMPPKIERDIYTTLYYLGANDTHNPNFKFKNKSDLLDALRRRLRHPLPEDELPAYDIDKNELRVYLSKYLDLAETLRQQSISTDDLHGENIGIKEGQLIHFDVMIV